MFQQVERFLWLLLRGSDTLACGWRQSKFAQVSTQIAFAVFERPKRRVRSSGGDSLTVAVKHHGCNRQPVRFNILFCQQPRLKVSQYKLNAVASPSVNDERCNSNGRTRFHSFRASGVRWLGIFGFAADSADTVFAVLECGFVPLSACSASLSRGLPIAMTFLFLCFG